MQLVGCTQWYSTDVTVDVACAHDTVMEFVVVLLTFCLSSLTSAVLVDTSVTFCSDRHSRHSSTISICNDNGAGSCGISDSNKVVVRTVVAVVVTAAGASVGHRGVQHTGCMDIEPEPSRGVPC